ncbi:FAD-dependent oxidoreductase [Peribacillus cavernae]|uniref:FAD-dependent oxidoreductase n=1 Tax=Peribacillus cavernae TaxID=1674310 RepID=A0A3S0U2L0_9BACI|nr:FAD-dependent oxidoreductase [Peribacillus cavernae]RUQ32801.1 FAD-dependent oxidoreductase [Peribacillus cavernae]
MELFGKYDVVVVGAGITGVVASIRAARQGVKTLLVEGSGVLGGLVTGGRLTKPAGLVNGGIYKELINRAAENGGADNQIRSSKWGSYSGVFDAEVMQRVIIEVIEEANVEVLLHTQVTDVIRNSQQVKGIQIQTKSGTKLVLAKVVIDASGDGDVACLAKAQFLSGRSQDGLMQPITSYFRVLNVDIPSVVQDFKEHIEDMWELNVPEKEGATNEDYVLNFFAAGLTERIENAKKDGFNWIVPRDHMALKAGLIPGELNINATRFHGNGLDERTLSRAEIEIRKQAYNAFDFLKKYVRGFENSIFLEVAPKLGIRETRRIVGEYMLTKADVTNEARFEDAIGLSNCPIDIHEPDGEKLTIIDVGKGYGIPFRCLIPKDVDGLLVAGRCISADDTAFGSTRNTPSCALTGEAAAVGAAYATKNGVLPREVPIKEIQRELSRDNSFLGTPDENHST